MNRLLLIITLGLLSAMSVAARETITGTVVNSHGEPIPGVKIEIPGSSEFFFTDLDGAFQITLKEPVKKLRFTYPKLGTVTHNVKPEMKVVLGKGWAGREKGFRYLLDLEGGMGFKGKVTMKSGTELVSDIHTFLMAGLTNTYGCQINRNLFVGIGYGAYLDLTGYNEIDDHYSYQEVQFTGVNVPLFLKVRWDFGLSQKTAPYVGLRIGYNRFVCVDDGYISEFYGVGSDNWSYAYVEKQNYGSFFIAPSIGYRMTLHNKIGMNLGLRYMTGMKCKYTVNDYYDNGYYKEFIQPASDVLFFNIGFDF